MQTSAQTRAGSAPAAADMRARAREHRRTRAEILAARAEPGIQHSRGKLTVEERLAALFDEGSCVEVETLRRHRASGFGLEAKRPYGDGVVAGWGAVDGRRVFYYAHDFRVFGGSLGEAHAAKIHKVMDLALATGAPLIALCDGAGARIQEGVVALAGYGGIFSRHVRGSGVIPQISVVLGPCAGGAAYAPALCDFVFMVRGAGQMYVTGPDVVRAVTGEQVTHEDLGGADVHARTSGVAAFVHDDERECFEAVRTLLAFLPDNNHTAPPWTPPADTPDRRCEALLDLVPAELNRVYDVRAVLGEVFDDGDYLEVHESWAPNVVCALARLDGHPVGVLANQAAVLAGALDIAAAQKAARFVQLCDAFHLPIVSLVDVPGFLPGTDQERDGIIRHGAKLLYAYCDATVPRVQVVLRKAYGGAYIVMDSRSIGADLSYAWPVNEIAVMGAQAAADVLFRREIAAAADPEAVRTQRMTEYRRQLTHPDYAAEHGLVDDVIDPSDTRPILIEALAMLRGKYEPNPVRKHGNPPM
ncbi:carboxyl transferase [Catenulispora acidiphila DSM 44928]|uniref:Carboxyl transferase n=1 Tax=Catenulispora acidiphila (strain DSM 44928 / JCM 14897 / NBRC 102108 / NRRL B-24433 / ID139908) TaxID=479433 RepID=C7PY62_CATAD|nr:acyl-CoA carboxylase subunit beta [Catenulispora acidiphila]ACU75352.1 carboxyl transferase [Catenulispora acidiphila DSM 44928]